MNIIYSGTILAPYADIIDATGQLSGQIFAKSWVMTGSRETFACMRQNNCGFTSCITEVNILCFISSEISISFLV
jgi:hypothetical protein